MAESLFRKILVPIDFSPCSEEAFRGALTFAKTFQSEWLLLHVADTSALATPLASCEAVEGLSLEIFRRRFSV